MSFGASPELANTVMAGYRLRLVLSIDMVVYTKVIMNCGHIAFQPTLTNTSNSNKLLSPSNLQMSVIQPLPSYPVHQDSTTQHGSFLTNSNISLLLLSSLSIIKQSIVPPLVSWNTNHPTSLPDATHRIYYPSVTRSTITATGSLPYAQENIADIQH
ncbi:hypothetical protein INT45_010750 [Circinella minor]|uniref:Uncharacterized protein n=1 Tax=Circinella minor TaxID=1195481 RepID=A0A8H7RYU0_9FUNG|nr:hypothetical protein INT45_010750 [Circinella minor]